MAKPLRISGRDWKGWLQIKPSAIPDAGRGLFARKDIPARTVLGEYHGRPIKTLRDIYALREDRYVIEVTLPDRKSGWIDGNVSSNYLRFVNGTKPGSAQRVANVDSYQYAGSLMFRATRAITAGEELILDYSEEHWECYSNADGIKHRNDELLIQLRKDIDDCTDTRVRAALRGMAWLINQMSSVGAYYAFFVGYLWMFYEFRLSKCNPVITNTASRVLKLELNGAQFRLRKIFKPNLENRWYFISLIPMLYEVDADAQEYASFYRSYFPQFSRRRDTTFDECRQGGDFAGMMTMLMDYCVVEIARHSNRYSRLFKLPEPRFSEYWQIIRHYDIRALEASVKNDDEQFELDYHITHLVMCRYGFGSRGLARPSKFDAELKAYLMRHEGRILGNTDDLDLIAEVAYCYLEMNTQRDWVHKAIKKIIAAQNADGSWLAKDEKHLPMYDRLHATWTAIAALCFSLSQKMH